MSRMPIQDRRTQVVDAALTVALRDGLERTTVRAIAAEAGVSLGVLHYCFADKTEIMQAVVRRMTEQSLGVALGALVGGDDDWADLLVDRYVAMIVAHPDTQLLTVEIAVAGLRDPSLARVAADQQAVRLAGVERFLAEVSPGAGGEVARYVLRQLDGGVLAWLVDRDDAVLRESAGSILAAVRAGVLPELAAAAPLGG